MKKFYFIVAISLVGFLQAQNSVIIYDSLNQKKTVAAHKNFPIPLRKMNSAPKLKTLQTTQNFLEIEQIVRVMDSNFSGQQPFGKFSLSGPYDLNVIGNISDTYQIFADDYDQNGILYALDNNNKRLLIVNPLTAAITDVAPLTGLSADTTVTSLAYSYQRNQFFLMTHGSAGSVLYLLNKESGVCTPIGLSGNFLGVWLVIDNDGSAFSVDLSSNQLKSINLDTGVATEIGSLGIALNYAQEADVNTIDNTIYMAAYLSNGSSGIYKVDKATGLATLLGSTGSAEYTMFSIDGPNPLAINDAFLKKSLVISQNPVADFLNIVSNKTVDSMEIYSTTGQLLLKTKSTGTINLSSLQPGLYFVNVNSNGKIQSLKFLKN
jgi:hypothetical protein